MKKQHCYPTLPAGYREVYRINAKDVRTGLIFTALSLVILAVICVPLFLLTDFSEVFETVRAGGVRVLLLYFGFLLSIVVYLILHELTHGVVYKLMTGQRLTFGISWSCAFCGVPDVWCDRITSLVALIMPFAVFSLILLPLTVILYFTDAALFLLCGLLFGIHAGGCCGDLFLFWLLLTRYRDPALLLRDTGPEQTLCLPEPSVPDTKDGQ